MGNWICFCTQVLLFLYFERGHFSVLFQWVSDPLSLFLRCQADPFITRPREEIHDLRWETFGGREEREGKGRGSGG